MHHVYLLCIQQLVGPWYSRTEKLSQDLNVAQWVFLRAVALCIPLVLLHLSTPCSQFYAVQSTGIQVHTVLNIATACNYKFAQTAW